MKTRIQSFLAVFTLLIGINICANNKVNSYDSNNLLFENDSIYETVDKVPVYKKSRGNIQKYLAKQLKYPVDALAKEIEGKVLVSFVVTKDGELANVELVKGLYESIDKEALRVIHSLDKWKPGVVNGEVVHTKVTLPVHFYISDESRLIAQQIKPFYLNDRAPLFVIDKKKVTGVTTLEYFNIKSIRVIKGSKAVELYGDEAQNGVLVVETKKGTEPIYRRY